MKVKFNETKRGHAISSLRLYDNKMRSVEIRMNRNRISLW